jgi:hypothetical protein
MPGELHGWLWDTHGEEVIQQGRQPEGIDDIGGVPQLVHPPPPMSGMVAALKGFHAGRVDAVVVDAIEEEIIAEHSARPAKICVAGAVGDGLSQGVRADEEPDLFAEFTCGGFVEELAVIDAATWSHPAMSLLDVHRIEEELQE